MISTWPLNTTNKQEFSACWDGTLYICSTQWPYMRQWSMTVCKSGAFLSPIVSWMDLNIQIEAMSKSRPPRIKSKNIKTSHLWLYNGEGEALRMHLLIMERRNKANMFFWTVYQPIFWDLKRVWEFRQQVPDSRQVSDGTLVGESGGLHVVAGPVCQTALTREQRQAFGFLQHHLQLLKIL